MKVLRRILGSIFGCNTLDYICGTEALPLPLSGEEEREVIRLLEDGDASARNELVEHNLRLVVYIAKKFEGSGADGDDLVSVGTIGLIKAINSFRSDKNIKLATYASRCIENEILMYLRRMSRLHREVSFDEPLNTDWEGNELLLSDVMGTDADAVYSDIEGGVERELLKASLSRLTPREQKIMRMRFGLDGGEEMTQKDVADSLGIPVTSLLALFSVLGLAVSLAVQDVLGNVAGGLVILFAKPFQIGDYIEADAGSGTVAAIDLTYTQLDTADGLRLMIPNSLLSDSKITNYTQLGTRRIDHAVTASYDDPIPAVRAACLEAVSMTPDILPDPAPAVVVTNYGESAIEYHVRCWSKVDTYWNANYALLENIKTCFDRDGVTMTYNHLNIHILDNDLEKKDHGTL